MYSNIYFFCVCEIPYFNDVFQRYFFFNFILFLNFT